MCRAFTLVQLLVVIGLLGLGIAMLLPSMCKSRETANRVKCQSNLSQLGKALLIYSNDNKGQFPRTHYVEGAPVSLTNDGFADANPFAVNPAGGKANNLPAAWFLLVRTQDVTTEVFTCPSGTAEKDLMANQAGTSRGNFSGDGKPGGSVANNVSYSLHNVYGPTLTPENPLPLITRHSSDFAVAADISPAPPDDRVFDAIRLGVSRSVMIKGNSRNHDRDGQNVLYADGHAEFQQSPLCGEKNDNIFSAAIKGTDADSSETGGGTDPVSVTDSVLLIHQK